MHKRTKALCITVVIFIFLSSLPATLAVSAADQLVAVPIISGLPETEPLTVVPTLSVVIINGEEISFDAYNVNGNNYFKLRDLALCLNGTDKQFGVGWDSEKNAITLSPTSEYEPNGSEMKRKNTTTATAIAMTSEVCMDDIKLELAAYTINGNNYFKLRDLGKELDFYVLWDKENNAIVIDTTRGYYPEAEDFYNSYFDTERIYGVTAGIPAIILRFHGSWDDVNPDDLTDLLLKRNYIPVDNKLTYTGGFDQRKWDDKDVTDFYFYFETNNKATGLYGASGNFKGVPFNLYEQYVEKYPVGDTPANPYHLGSADWVGTLYGIDHLNYAGSLSEITFGFTGFQEAFYQSDLTDLKMTLNGQEIAFDLESSVFRYFQYNQNANRMSTTFAIVLTEKLTKSGTYKFTGNYRGVPFVSREITIK